VNCATARRALSLTRGLFSVWTIGCERTNRNDFIAKESKKMLWTIFVILLVLWFLGLVTSYTLGGFVHILLVLAVVVLVFQLISGRRAI
jgi:asparagine N-glycosylation enzyme membrane subunit Stt3